MTVRLDDIASDTTDGKTVIHNTIEGYTTDITSTVANTQKYLVGIECGEKTYSGVIVDNDDGRVSILTCFEASNSEEVIVILDSGARKVATIVGSDSATGLCLLTIEVDYELGAISLSDADALTQGEYVIALSGKNSSGNSEVSFGVTSTTGFYELFTSAYLCELLTTDATVSERQYGGALLNLSGELIGILCKDPQEVDGSMSYGVSIDEVEKVYQELQDDQEVTRGSLNVSLRPVNEMESYEKNQNGFNLDTESGLFVCDVPEDSPAFEILNAGDRITMIEGRNMTDITDYRNLIYSKNSGDEVEVTFERNGEILKENVVLQ